MTHEPGWFPDPSGAFQQRYWDGEVWTERVRAYPPPSAPTFEASEVSGAPLAEVANDSAPSPTETTRPSQTQRASRNWIPLVVGIAVVIVAIAGYAAWRTSVDNASRRAAQAGAMLGGSGFDDSSGIGGAFPSTLSVTYTVSVNGYQENEYEADADITYETPSGTQQDEVDDGWSRTFTFNPGDFIYISAQNMTQGSVSCTIEVDGSVVSSNSSSGEFKIATCDGTAG